MIGKNVNSKEEGEWKYYHENGQLAIIGKYVNGKREGEWYMYNEDGSLRHTFNDGSLEDIGRHYKKIP